MLGENRMSIWQVKKHLASFILIMLITLCITCVALADVGGYAQTGIDRFNHSFESLITGDPAYDIATIALAQLNKTGSELGYYDGDWCAAFVVDCAKYAGVENLMPFISGHTHGVGGANGYEWLYETMVKKGATVVNVNNAKRGDIVFFGGNDGGNHKHVGIMTDNVHTVEGNMNGYGTNPWLNAQVLTSVRTRYNRVTILRPNYPAPKGILDINGYLDGRSSGSLGAYGTFDIRVGSQTYSGQNDYYSSVANGTTYEIPESSITPNEGYEYTGVRTGSLTGKVSAGQKVEVSLGFATKGRLVVRGCLDGEQYDSVSDYCTFDMYIKEKNGTEHLERNCIEYNEQWPNGTTYEIRNIQTANGKNYSESDTVGLTGTITSNTQSVAVLYLTSDGPVSTEWQIGKALPGNLNPDELDVLYNNHYESISANSPPEEGWIQGELVSTEYVNSGSPYQSHVELATSNTRELISYYYYHWCATSGNNANYEPTSKYVHYDQITDVSSVRVENTETDAIDSSYTIYNLKWTNGSWAYCKSGKTCDGSSGSHGERSYHWYRMNTYQDKTEVRKYKWTKDSGWVDTRYPSAASCDVRWRYKGGVLPVPPEEYVLTINGWLDGVQSDNTFGYGCFDLYVDGEKAAEDCYGIKMTFDHNPVYSIENIRTAVGKIYDGVHTGRLSGEIPSGNATVTLSFTTVMDINENWTETASIPEGMDLTGCDVEYKHHYEVVSATSPGDDWTQAGVASVEYVNNGSPYKSHVELPTSDTRELVSYYYYHWCATSGNNANYEPTSKYVHYDQITNVSSVRVANTETDAIDSSYTIYNLQWTNGNWAYCKSGTTCDGNSGTHGERSYHWYRMNTYQDKTAVYKYRWVKDTDWSSECDPQATSVSIRIKLKQYDIYLDGNGGAPSVGLFKFYDVYLNLGEHIPEREDYIFTGWNTESDGTGEAYDANFVYTVNAPITLFAQWIPISVVTLPAGTETIEEEAFANSGVRIVRVPSGCTTIEARAFAECTHLSKIYIPRSVTYIDTSAFDGVDSIIFVGSEDSIAELYAFKRDWITFEVEQQ